MSVSTISVKKIYIIPSQKSGASFHPLPNLKICDKVFPEQPPRRLLHSSHNFKQQTKINFRQPLEFPEASNSCMTSSHSR